MRIASSPHNKAHVGPTEVSGADVRPTKAVVVVRQAEVDGEAQTAEIMVAIPTIREHAFAATLQTSIVRMPEPRASGRLARIHPASTRTGMASHVSSGFRQCRSGTTEECLMAPTHSRFHWIL